MNPVKRKNYNYAATPGFFGCAALRSELHEDLSLEKPLLCKMRGTRGVPPRFSDDEVKRRLLVRFII